MNTKIVEKMNFKQLAILLVVSWLMIIIGAVVKMMSGATFFSSILLWLGIIGSALAIILGVLSFLKK